MFAILAAYGLNFGQMQCFRHSAPAMLTAIVAYQFSRCSYFPCEQNPLLRHREFPESVRPSARLIAAECLCPSDCIQPLG